MPQTGLPPGAVIPPGCTVDEIYAWQYYATSDLPTYGPPNGVQERGRDCLARVTYSSSSPGGGAQAVPTAAAVVASPQPAGDVLPAPVPAIAAPPADPGIAELAAPSWAGADAVQVPELHAAVAAPASMIAPQPLPIAAGSGSGSSSCSLDALLRRWWWLLVLALLVLASSRKRRG